MKKLTLFSLLCLLATILLISILGFLLYDLVLKGYDNLSWEFLTSAPSNGMQSGGIFPAIFGTIFVTIVMSIFVVPIGILTAIFINEYFRDGFFVRFIRVIINNLAGLPSIVFGLFGLGFFVNFIGKTVIDKWILGDYNVWGKPAIIWSSLTLVLLTLPLVVVSTLEALKSVPKELKDSSMALGATKFQTIFRIIIPYSLSGILSGSILAVSRAAGEVAPIMFTGAVAYLKNLPSFLNDQFMHLGYHIYTLVTHSSHSENAEGILYSTVLVLLALIFLLNIFVIFLRMKLRKRYNL